MMEATTTDLLSVIALVFTTVFGTETSSPSRIVLPQGPVAGIRLFSGARGRVNAYLGIPYALPPVGDLRFAAPVRHPGWNATLFAGHFRPDCPQLRSDDRGASQSSTDEDCLYLNVFVPDAAYGSLPVAVFIHGNDYVSGSPLIVAPEELAGEGLVLITLGYRLNVFGFLTFGDDFARGNLGLLDQYMALVWIRENIKFLGGSPDNVTLVGHGSGASSILVHLTSPRTKDLFHRVVLMSGSLISPWLRTRPHSPIRVSRNIARSLGCYTSGGSFRGALISSESVLTCMRSKSQDEILRAFHNSYQNGNWSDALVPQADNFLAPDNQYLPLDPVHALEQGKFHRMPILTGMTPNEGTLALDKWKDLVSGRDEDVVRFADTTAITDALARYNLTSSESRAIVRWNYFDRDEKATSLRQLLQLYTDAMFAAPFSRQLRVLSRWNRPIYVYLFTHPSPFDHLGNYGQVLNLSEAAHGAELPFLFGPALFQKVAGRRFTAVEERLSIKMKRLWASFIRSGNPNPSPYGPNLWDEYSVGREGGSRLRLFADPETGENLRKETSSADGAADTFWNALLPNVHAMVVHNNPRHDEEVVYTGGTTLGTSDGSCTSYKNAMFTILAFLIILLFVLLLSLLLLKKRTKERDRSIL